MLQKLVFLAVPFYKYLYDMSKHCCSSKTSKFLFKINKSIFYTNKIENLYGSNTNIDEKFEKYQI